MLDSLLSPIAILDGDGAILDANAAWRDFGGKNGLTDRLPPIGTNYLTTLGASPQQSLATAAMAGIRAVLRGQQDRFETVYPCHTPHQEQWFLMRAHALTSTRAGKVLVSHHDVSLLKRTEAELLRAHQQTQDMAAAAVPGVARVVHADAAAGHAGLTRGHFKPAQTGIVFCGKDRRLLLPLGLDAGPRLVDSLLIHARFALTPGHGAG